MKESDEMVFHRKMQQVKGKYEAMADWGKIVMTLDAVPNYAGGKGCPDEILVVKVKFAILGTDIELSTPVLIELEKIGHAGAEQDLTKFCERSIINEQESYLEIPMVIVGGDNYKKLKSQRRQLTARINITQVPKRVIR